jgi:hypothetical protein
VTAINLARVLKHAVMKTNPHHALKPVVIMISVVALALKHVVIMISVVARVLKHAVKATNPHHVLKHSAMVTSPAHALKPVVMMVSVVDLVRMLGAKVSVGVSRLVVPMVIVDQTSRTWMAIVREAVVATTSLIRRGVAMSRSAAAGRDRCTAAITIIAATAAREIVRLPPAGMAVLMARTCTRSPWTARVITKVRSLP